MPLLVAVRCMPLTPLVLPLHVRPPPPACLPTCRPTLCCGTGGRVCRPAARNCSAPLFVLLKTVHHSTTGPERGLSADTSIAVPQMGTLPRAVFMHPPELKEDKGRAQCIMLRFLNSFCAFLQCVYEPFPPGRPGLPCTVHLPRFLPGTLRVTSPRVCRHADRSVLPRYVLLPAVRGHVARVPAGLHGLPVPARRQEQHAGRR